MNIKDNLRDLRGGIDSFGFWLILFFSAFGTALLAVLGAAVIGGIFSLSISSNQMLVITIIAFIVGAGIGLGAILGLE